MSQFEKLDQLVLLAKSSRLNAAKSIWDSLDKEFRTRVLKYVLELANGQPQDFEVPTTHLSTPFGDWVLSREKLLDLKACIPRVLNV